MLLLIPLRSIGGGNGASGVARPFRRRRRLQTRFGELPPADIRSIVNVYVNFPKGRFAIKK
jgi:hypothetical protein